MPLMASRSLARAAHLFPMMSSSSSIVAMCLLTIGSSTSAHSVSARCSSACRAAGRPIAHLGTLARLAMPAGVVENEDDGSAGASAGLAREGFEQRGEERLRHAIMHVPKGLAARRRDEGRRVKPNRSDDGRARWAVRRIPYQTRRVTGFSPSRCSSLAKTSTGRSGCFGRFFGNGVFETLAWPAPPFGVVGSPEAQIGGMDDPKDYLRARRRHR